MPLTVDWSVSIDGQNITSRLNPYVMEIEVVDGDDAGSDSCRITLSDDGRLIMPRKGAQISVGIMGVQVFSGILKSPRCTLGKGQGGIMILNASGHDTEGKGKEGQQTTKEDGTLGDFLTEMGKKAGYSVKLDPQLAKIKRTFWAAEGRSFHHMAQALANEYGATLKFAGKKAVLAKRGNGTAPNGQAMPTIRATFPGNLISVDMEPYEGSAVFRDVRFSWFDRKKARFEEEKADVRLGQSSGTAAATKVMRGRAASKEDAKDRSEGRANTSERDKGGGTVEIDIEPRARAEATCIVSGTRPGIDGSYRISTVTHTLRAGEGGGATTKLELKQPDGEAGKDSRKAGDTGGTR